MDQRVLPSAPETELAVLAKCLQDRSLIPELISLEPGDFYDPRNQKIFALLKENLSKNLSVDVFALRDQVVEQSEKDYLLELSSSTDGYLSDFKSLLQVLKDKAQQRALISLCISAEVRAYSGEENLLPTLIGDLLKLEQPDGNKRSFDSKELVSSFFDEVSNLSEGKKTRGIPFGFSDLNTNTPGAKQGDLILIAGRPSQGKSAFLDNVVQKMLDQSRAVYFVSAESSKEEVMGRIVGRMSGIGYGRLVEGIKSDDEWNRFNDAMGKFEKYKIVLNDDPGMTTERILIEAMQLKLQGKLDVVLIDYLQFLKDKVKGDFEERRIAQISTNLKTLARRLEVPVIAACQLNREIAGREEKAPRLSDLRYSGQLEQDADLVVGMWRENNVSEITNFRILKQRNGPLAEFTLRFNGKLCHFEDLSPIYNPALSSTNATFNSK